MSTPTRGSLYIANLSPPRKSTNRSAPVSPTPEQRAQLFATFEDSADLSTNPVDETTTTEPKDAQPVEDSDRGKKKETDENQTTKSTKITVPYRRHEHAQEAALPPHTNRDENQLFPKNRFPPNQYDIEATTLTPKTSNKPSSKHVEKEKLHRQTNVEPVEPASANVGKQYEKAGLQEKAARRSLEPTKPVTKKVGKSGETTKIQDTSTWKTSASNRMQPMDTEIKPDDTNKPKDAKFAFAEAQEPLGPIRTNDKGHVDTELRERTKKGMCRETIDDSQFSNSTTVPSTRRYSAENQAVGAVCDVHDMRSR